MPAGRMPVVSELSASHEFPKQSGHQQSLIYVRAGLNFGRTALFAGDALYAWGSLALQHASNWRHR